MISGFGQENPVVISRVEVAFSIVKRSKGVPLRVDPQEPHDGAGLDL